LSTEYPFPRKHGRHSGSAGRSTEKVVRKKLVGVVEHEDGAKETLFGDGFGNFLKDLVHSMTCKLE
jgi:hypothetical protein